MKYQTRKKKLFTDTLYFVDPYTAFKLTVQVVTSHKAKSNERGGL